jgi:hypothetical protein
MVKRMAVISMVDFSRVILSDSLNNTPRHMISSKIAGNMAIEMMENNKGAGEFLN